MKKEKLELVKSQHDAIVHKIDRVLLAYFKTKTPERNTKDHRNVETQPYRFRQKTATHYISHFKIPSTYFCDYKGKVVQEDRYLVRVHSTLNKDTAKIAHTVEIKDMSYIDDVVLKLHIRNHFDVLNTTALTSKAWVLVDELDVILGQDEVRAHEDFHNWQTKYNKENA